MRAKRILSMINQKRRFSLQMKATGIVRRIDELGRVVIPKEIRRTLRIREGDALEIYTDREGGVILKNTLSANFAILQRSMPNPFSNPLGILRQSAIRTRLLQFQVRTGVILQSALRLPLTNRYTMTLRPLCKCVRSLTAALPTATQ